ncbi:hypothetical protein LC593_05470 [Nostoc sp. CHAB 5844]|nr:hypothetical protein [Nostoc sp. CHAB 5844]
MLNCKICRRSFLFLGGASLVKGLTLALVIVVYDAKNPAPAALKQDWARFQQGDRRKSLVLRWVKCDRFLHRLMSGQETYLS